MRNLLEEVRDKKAQQIMGKIENGKDISIEEFYFLENYCELQELFGEIFNDKVYILSTEWRG